MGRPSKLTPAQWSEVERRVAAGEGPSAIAREFGVNPSQITRRVMQVAQSVRNVAQQLATAQTALAELPVAQQYNAMRLADKLRSIADSYASAAELGAKTGHRLHALANSEAGKVNGENLMTIASVDAMKGIALLTKLGNEALMPASNLLAANKERVAKLDEPPPDQKEPLRPQISREEWLKLHAPT